MTPKHNAIHSPRLTNNKQKKSKNYLQLFKEQQTVEELYGLQKVTEKLEHKSIDGF